MKTNMNQWIEGIISSQKRTALPVMTYPGLALTGKTVNELVSDSKTQYECIEALSKRYDFAAYSTTMDLSVESEAFGSPVRFTGSEAPVVTGKIVEDMESVENLEVPTVGSGRTSVYLEAARIASKEISKAPVFGGVIGPISLAARLFDMTELMMAIVLEPETIHALLEKCTKFIIDYSKAFKETGCNGIIIAEPAAGLISPEHCSEFSSAYVKKIVDAVQDDYFAVILHNCGNTVNLVPSLLSTGAKGLHFGNAVNMMDILPQIPPNVLAFGNIDPANIFKNGTAADVKAKTMNLLKEAASYKNFVLSSGCDVPPGTPIENIDVFYNTLKEFNSSIIEDHNLVY